MARVDLESKKGSRALAEEVFVGVQRTADLLLRGVEEALKPAGLSPAQYNVLRILRGAGPEGLACGEVAERMITRDPDITRLLDRLEARALVSRTRERRDRRVIVARISEQGLAILKGLDRPLRELHRRQLGHLGAGKLRNLLNLLNLGLGSPVGTVESPRRGSGGGGRKTPRR